MLAVCVALLLVSGTEWGIHALFSSAKKEKVTEEKKHQGQKKLP